MKNILNEKYQYEYKKMIVDFGSYIQKSMDFLKKSGKISDEFTDIEITRMLFMIFAKKYHNPFTDSAGYVRTEEKIEKIIDSNNYFIF